MSPQSSRRRRSSPELIEPGSPRRSSGLGLVLTAFLLAILLLTGPIVLGGARLWIEMPLLCGVAVLLFLQGARILRSFRPEAGFRIDAIDVAAILFVAYTMARWLTSPTEYFSRIEMLEVVAYAGIFFTCRYGMPHRKPSLFLLYLLIALGVGETAFGYYLSHYSDPSDPSNQWFLYGPTENLQLHYFPRWLGTYGCPNHYAALLVMATGAALALASFSRLAWPIRIVLFYVAAILLVGIMESISRGSWVALVAAIGALMFFAERNGTSRWWVPFVAGFLLLGAIAYGFSRSPNVQLRTQELIDTIRTGRLDSYIRVQLAEDALRISHDHPWFGTGPGTFVFIHPRYQSSTFGFKAVLTHDDYLNLLDDYGLVGFGIAMFFIWAVTLTFLRPMRIEQRWYDRVIVATGFAAWTALLFHSWLDFNLHIPANAFLLFALTGLALGRLKDENSAAAWISIPLARLGPWLGGAIMVFSIVYGLEAARTGISDIIYEKTFALTDEVPTSTLIEGTEEALWYDAGNAQAWTFLGDIYKFRAAAQKKIEDRVREGQKALDAYGHGLAANPLDDTVQARRAMTFDIMRRYTEAFLCYKDAVTEQPYNGQFWFRLGNHFWQRRMLPKAEEAFLLAEHCPHGGGDGADAEKRLRDLPQMLDVPIPEPGTNPLLPQPDHPPVVLP